MSKSFLLSLLLCLGGASYGATTATVKVVRGKVTKLLPGSFNATPVKKGDILPEDTSLVTKKKSFVRVIFSDKSSMNLGPESKIVINKMPKQEATMVNLLTGMIKAKVNKNVKKKSKTKMVVRTKTAVMGVRGTQFQTTYNPANEATSLVTVEGKVAMVKAKHVPKKILAKTEVKDHYSEIAKEGAKNPTKKAVSDGIVVDNEALKPEEVDKIFEASEKVVEVPAGRYSGVIESVEKPTIPVKIAPKQYDAIAESMGSKTRAKDVMKVTDTDLKPEGFENAATGDFAPKAGGIIDFNTGIYIAPSADAKLDKETGTFEATKDIGKITKSGEYIPPEGIKIDAKRGFVIDHKQSKNIAMAGKKEEVQQTLEKLNTQVKKPIVVVNKIEKKPKPEPKKPGFWEKYGPKDHILSAQIRPYSEVLTVKNTNTNSEADFYTESANYILFSWKHVWNDKWGSRLQAGGHDYEIDESDVNVYHFGGDDGGGFFAIGINYKISQKLLLEVDLVDRSLFYVTPSGGDGGEGVEIRDDSLSSIRLGLVYQARKWDNFDLAFRGNIDLTGDTSVPSEFGDKDSGDHFAFELGMDSYYSWRKNLGINSMLWYARHSATGSDLEFTRNSFGLGFEFVYDI